MKYLFWLCFSFKGRISRKTFWIYAVASLFIHQALKEIPVALMELDPALEGTRDLVIAFGLLMFFKITHRLPRFVKKGTTRFRA